MAGLTVKVESVGEIEFQAAILLGATNQSSQAGEWQPGIYVVTLLLPDTIGGIDRDFIIKDLPAEASRLAAINTAFEYIKNEICGAAAASILADHAKEP